MRHEAAAAADAPALSVQGLQKSFSVGRHSVAAVDDVSLEIRPGELYTLLGPSGCGKTTTLRCIAGVERPDRASISIAGRVVTDVSRRVFIPPYRRNLGMVFQSYAIWPHMTVFDNVAFPLRVTGIGRSEVRRRVMEALEVVGLAGLEGRLAPQLSGGQQQRTALARALVGRPRLLLLDEPLSNLDARLREAMRDELRALQRQLGITAIYVTHDQVEALSLSTRMAVMYRGRVVQEGTPAEIYQRPASRFVAAFVGASNFLEGELVGSRNGRVRVRTRLGELVAPSRGAERIGASVELAIRPEHVRLMASGDASERAQNEIDGIVAEAHFMGEAVDYLIEVGTLRLKARQPAGSLLPVGERVRVRLPAESCALLQEGANP